MPYTIGQGLSFRFLRNALLTTSSEPFIESSRGPVSCGCNGKGEPPPLGASLTPIQKARNQTQRGAPCMQMNPRDQRMQELRSGPAKYRENPTNRPFTFIIVGVGHPPLSYSHPAGVGGGQPLLACPPKFPPRYHRIVGAPHSRDTDPYPS
jgi:hypothetical protein